MLNSTGQRGVQVGIDHADQAEHEVVVVQRHQQRYEEDEEYVQRRIDSAPQAAVDPIQRDHHRRK